MSIHQEKLIRFTIEMESSLHRKLKMACAESDISMRNFVTKAIEQRFEAIEDALDDISYIKGMKDIAEHGTISLEEMDKAMGI